MVKKHWKYGKKKGDHKKNRQNMIRLRKAYNTEKKKKKTKDIT